MHQVLLAAWLLLAATGTAAAPELGSGLGRVVRVDADRGTVTLGHGAIAGWLPAGRTEFPVEPPELLSGVRAGDAVRFSLAPDPAAHGLLVVSAIGVVPDDEGQPALPRRLAVTAGALGALGLLLAALLGLAVAHWRSLRRVRYDLAQAARARAELRQQLDGLTRALADVARVLERDHVGRLVEVRTEVERAIAGPDLFVVRAGERQLFADLRARVEDPNRVHVVWDRRRGERRANRAPVVRDRRRGDRRGPPPATWDAFGYVLVTRRPRAGGSGASGRSR